MPAAIAPLGERPGPRRRQHERRAVGRREPRRPLEERADDLAADGAGAEHADAQGLDAHRVDGLRTTGVRAMAPIGHRTRLTACGRAARRRTGAPLHSGAMTVDARPRPAPLAAPPRAAADLLAASSRPGSSTSATTWARSATTSMLQYEYEAIYCIVDYHALTSTHDAGRAAAADARDGRSPARARPRPGALHAVRPEPPPRAHRARCGCSRRSRRSAGSSGRRRTRRRSASQPDDVNHGLLTYPVLQAADIVIYKASLRAGRARTRPPTSSCRARSSARSTTATARRSPSRRRCSPRRRSCSARTASRRCRKSVGNTIDILGEPDADPEAGHVDGHRHEADPAHRPRPAGGLQRLPAAPLLRRRLRGRSGTASGPRGPAASTRRSCSPSGSSTTTRRPASATRS